MAGLEILKHIHSLSDEALCERWLESPYYQYFCGAEFFCHKLPFERSSLTRWRQRMGEERLVALLQESLAAAGYNFSRPLAWIACLWTCCHTLTKHKPA